MNITVAALPEGNIVQICLEWVDVEILKNNGEVCDRHNGEQKVCLACVPEQTLLDWWKSEDFQEIIAASNKINPSYVEFMKENSDLYVFLCKHDIYNGFLGAVTFNKLPKNPFFKKIKIIFPNYCT